MYAIIKSGGKQYRVEKGATVYVDLIDTKVGEKITIEDVLLVAGDGKLSVGAPLVAKAAVTGTVVEHGRDAKIRVFKYKKRKGYRRTKGHRQSYTAVKIDSIELGA